VAPTYHALAPAEAVLPRGADWRSLLEGSLRLEALQRV
jgi:hypothetical protein